MAFWESIRNFFTGRKNSGSSSDREQDAARKKAANENRMRDIMYSMSELEGHLEYLRGQPIIVIGALQKYKARYDQLIEQGLQLKNEMDISAFQRTGLRIGVTLMDMEKEIAYRAKHPNPELEAMQISQIEAAPVNVEPLKLPKTEMKTAAVSNLTREKIIEMKPAEKPKKLMETPIPKADPPKTPDEPELPFEPEADLTPRQLERLNRARTIILKQRGTPLETLIGKVGAMGAEEIKALRPKGASTGSEKSEASRPSKEKTKPETKDGTEEKDAEGAADALLEKVDKAGELAGLIGGVNSVVEDSDLDVSEDVAHLTGAQKKELQFADGVTGWIGRITSIMTGAANLVTLIKSSMEAFKADFSEDGEVTQNAQGRWRNARNVLHNIVELLDSGIGIADGYINYVPLLGPALGCVKNGMGFVLSASDAVTSGVYKSMLQARMDQIYGQMQRKRAKYGSKGEKPDKEAAKAYHLKKDVDPELAVDAKRRSLLKRITKDSGKEEDEEKHIKKVHKKDLRSKNDSKYREAQYGLGEKIRQEKLKGQGNYDKTKVRKMEALEMMEEYQESAKARKKMKKSLLHSVEELIVNGVALASNITKAVGQISTMTVVGASAGAGLLSVSAVMDLSVDAYSSARGIFSKFYKFIRDKAGSTANKNTTRENMGIAMVERMQEVAHSDVFEEKRFKDEAGLRAGNSKDVVRQSENVEQLDEVLQKGMDADMADLIDSRDAKELRTKISESFGQGD